MKTFMQNGKHLRRLTAVLLAMMLVLTAVVPMMSSAAITPGKPTYGSASGYGTNFTLTGDQAKDVIKVAEAQVYKKGSELGYSSAWCDAFVIDCARIANVPTSVIPNTRGCKALYDAIISKGGTKVTDPQAGDVVLYYCSTCKNYPHIGFYAGSGYTCEGNVGGSVSNSNRKSVYYVDGSGHSSASIVKSLYVRPAYTSSTKITINYNANGGSGTMASASVLHGATYTLSKNTFTRTGYTFTGWHAKRSDGKWYSPGNGWVTDSEIAANGYTKKLYEDAWAGTLNTSWTNGTTGNVSFTFYAQWKQATYNVHLWDNHSGKNYLRNTDFKTLDTAFYQSRDTAVYTLSVDSGRTADYGSLKIVGAAAGAPNSDMLWRAAINGNVANDGFVTGENKIMTLSFWAKSSVAGAKFYTRFGYQSTTDMASVTLTTDWTFYTITLIKDETCGHDFHPYFDKAGTFWISELQLEDGNVATEFVPEAGSYEMISVTAGQTYSNLPTPERDGYTFKGWYTAAKGGTKIDTDTAVMNGRLQLYAQWEANEPVGTPGDVNDDGAVDAGDAVLISRYDAGLVNLTDAQLAVGDVNDDGAVDAGDAVVISRYDAGLISTIG